MGSLSRTKGHSFERWLAALVRPLFPAARRQLEYHIDDCKGTDLQGTGRFKFQCKKLKKYAPISCIEEIKCDRIFGDIPVLVTAGDRETPMAVLPLEDLLELIETYLKQQ